MASEKTIETKVEVLLVEIKRLVTDVRDIKDILRSDYVTKTEFDSYADKVHRLEDARDWTAKQIVGQVITLVIGAALAYASFKTLN